MGNLTNKPVVRVVVVTLGLLLVPLIAMQFTDEVNWDLADFALMGVVLFVTGLLIDFAMKKMGRYGVVVASLIILAFLWLWAELAVGVFTNWGS